MLRTNQIDPAVIATERFYFSDRMRALQAGVHFIQEPDIITRKPDPFCQQRDVFRKAGAAVSGTKRIGILIFLCFFLFTASGLRAQNPAEALKTQEEKESYSIGYQVGLSMNTDGVDVDFESLIQGLHDAVDGTEPLLGNEEMRQFILDLKEKARNAQLKKVQELIVKNAEESKAFLEKNAMEKGVKTTGSGLQYVVLSEGKGESPGAKDKVTVHYRGTFPDGTEFDSSNARGEPQSFQTDGVIKGWTEALQMMKAGSKWKIIVPPELAYGRGGSGNRIPPNKVLLFEIELLSIEQGGQGGGN